MLLSVNQLNVHISQSGHKYPLLENINFNLKRGERLGIVGESGCGKTMLALALMGLLPEQISANGNIDFLQPQETHLKNNLQINKTLDSNLLKLSENELCQIRGHRIAMSFQEPMTALNPVQSIGIQVAESLKLHFHMNKHTSHIEASKILDRVGLPKNRFSRNLFPHQLSGGQRQRVVIAIAIACKPDLLIADEPTTALDVTIQKQIIDLLSELVFEENMALILITHNLDLAAVNTDQMLVMYAGKILEKGPTKNVFQNMRHPYTKGLFAAIPKITKTAHFQHKNLRFSTIPGQVPKYWEKTQGCIFSKRCNQAKEICMLQIPDEIALDSEHTAACLFAEKQEHA